MQANSPTYPLRRVWRQHDTKTVYQRLYASNLIHHGGTDVTKRRHRQRCHI